MCMHTDKRNSISILSKVYCLLYSFITSSVRWSLVSYHDILIQVINCDFLPKWFDQEVSTHKSFDPFRNVIKWAHF